ncbi:MAG: YihY/virulence factor BrkB family protein [Ignavibacteria bacterium]
MKNKILNIIRNSKPYSYFRKIRFFLHLRPTWHKFKSFSLHYFGGLYDRIDRHHVFLLGGGLAFSLFVCIIPTILIIFWLLGKFLNSAEVEIQIMTLIDTIIPYEAYSDFVKDVIFQRVREVVEFRNLAGFVGIVGLFFAASGFASSLRTVLNKVFGTDLDMNIFLGKLRDFIVILIVVLSFLVTTMSLPLLDFFRSLATSTSYLQFFNRPIFTHIISALISFILMILIFSLLYKFMPIIKIRKRSVLIGALWAALMWVGAKQLFGLYLSSFKTFSRIYGAYALGVVVAFWIYYTSIVFIIGAEIGKLFDERLDKKNQPDEWIDITSIT